MHGALCSPCRLVFICTVLVLVGLGLKWMEEPPDTVSIGADFPVSYKITYDQDFFHQMYASVYFNM
jgi:hypothetical protein